MVEPLLMMSKLVLKDYNSIHCVSLEPGQCRFFASQTLTLHCTSKICHVYVTTYSTPPPVHVGLVLRFFGDTDDAGWEVISLSNI